MEVTPVHLGEHLGEHETSENVKNTSDAEVSEQEKEVTETVVGEHSTSTEQVEEETEAKTEAETISQQGEEESATEELRIHDDISDKNDDEYNPSGDQEESDDDYDPEQSVIHDASPDLDGQNELASTNKSLSVSLENDSEDKPSEMQDKNEKEDENKDTNENDEDDDYDPEETLHIPKEKSSTKDKSVAVVALNELEDDDDYEPSVSTVPSSKPAANSLSGETTPSNSILKGKAPPVGLPPKPQLNPVHSAPISDANDVADHQLNEAYETIMNSDLVKDPEFVKLPAQEQMQQIMKKLEESNVVLNPNIKNNPDINYDQVYSYNKPFKNLKNPIPLIPVNEFCRRPNITAPMTREEEAAYQKFIKTETYYMRTQKWEEFPDKLRLFIGNLPANTISKQDLFRIFSQYGEVVQISIKAGFGFAQFRTAEQCLACIKGEENVPLHNKIMRLDASKPQTAKSNRDKRVGERGGRERERDSFSESTVPDDSFDASKRRKTMPDCFVYITGKSSVFFTRKVKKTFTSAQISIQTDDVTHKDINDVIQEAAYSGVLGVCVVKDMKVDLQTFQETPDGGVKFDEYAEIEPEVAVDILLKARQAKYGSLYIPPPPQEHQILQQQNAYSAGPEPFQGGTNNNSNNNNRGYDHYGGAGNRRSGSSGGSRMGDHHRGGRNRDRRQQGYGHQGPPQQQQFSGQPWSSNQAPQGYYGNPGYGSSDPQGYGGYNNNDTNMNSNNNNPYNQQYPPQGQGQPPYGSGPSYGDNSYGSNSYGSGPSGNNFGNNQQPDTNALLSSLKSIDPQSMQSMINMLQQRLQPQPQQQRGGMPPPQQYGQYGQNQNQNQPPAANQVSSLLSQLKSSRPLNQSYNGSSNDGDAQGGSSALSLMETLARLSRK